MEAGSNKGSQFFSHVQTVVMGALKSKRFSKQKLGWRLRNNLDKSEFSSMGAKDAWSWNTHE